ncbi:hypothetical protein BpHYR1_039575 [Brachionus plicatilis]|uniref:Uncharacterized protein n=1 Tax=Brachionus plicatilis TaxID=10195 RepID=A0A3M7SCJ7_BRAPC|nr:hypothetical protein BpHYR1_039575 [Brachionus plicatilis]
MYYILTNEPPRISFSNNFNENIIIFYGKKILTHFQVLFVVHSVITNLYNRREVGFTSIEHQNRKEVPKDYDKPFCPNLIIELESQNLFEYWEARRDLVKKVNPQKIKSFFEAKTIKDYKNSRKFWNFYKSSIKLREDADFDSFPEELFWDDNKPHALLIKWKCLIAALRLINLHFFLVKIIIQADNRRGAHLSSTFLSNDSDLTQMLLHLVDQITSNNLTYQKEKSCRIRYVGWLNNNNNQKND